MNSTLPIASVKITEAILEYRSKSKKVIRIKVLMPKLNKIINQTSFCPISRKCNYWRNFACTCVVSCPLFHLNKKSFVHNVNRWLEMLCRPSKQSFVIPDTSKDCISVKDNNKVVHRPNYNSWGRLRTNCQILLNKNNKI